MESTTQRVAVTPREYEIMTRLREGLTGKQIAEELSCSPRAVEAVLQSLYRRAGIHNHIQAVMLLTTSQIEIHARPSRARSK